MKFVLQTASGEQLTPEEEIDLAEFYQCQQDDSEFRMEENGEHVFVVLVN